MNRTALLLAVTCTAVANLAEKAIAAIEPKELRCEYLVNPLGIDVGQPRLSWIVVSQERGQKQTAYRILVASSREALAGDRGDLWDSGEVKSDQTIHISYAGTPMASQMRCFWKVQVRDKDGQLSAWSEPATWTMGLLKPADWQAQWIAYPARPATAPPAEDKKAGKRTEAIPQPATMLRKEFDLGATIRRATVSVTGLGVYELRINGRKVGDHVLAPEWTRYGKRIQYQTYDVTDLLRAGKNAVAARLAEGWWAGPMMLKSALAKPQFCLLMRLDMELADGSTRTVVTDPSWRATADGPIRRAGIYAGEVYDATKEMPGWDDAGFDDSGWQRVQVLPHPQSIDVPVLVAQPNEPIRVIRELRPVKMTEPKPGVYVFDLGQNMVGWCRLKLDGPPGTKVTVRHAEMLNDDGTIYTANLRGAAQIDEYTLRGGPVVWQPHFTYHGFRYVELSFVGQVANLPGTSGDSAGKAGWQPAPHPTKDAVLGRVFHSAAPEAGTFSCSNELVNKIMHNVEWVQRGNMHGVPTDCPQRDEREGWMGDIQAFSQTAIFQRDMAGFFTKWVRDVRDSQADDGRYPDIAPHPADPNTGTSGVPAWGDAGTVVPWRMYQNYGDTRLLAEHFESARRWIDYIDRHNPNHLWANKKSRGNDYNDWLNGDTLELKGYPRGISACPHDVFGTTFFAHSTEIVAKMARVLGRADDAAKYKKLFEDIKAAFRKEYVSPDGRIKGDTQAGYALSLNFNLLPPDQNGPAVAHLLEAIKKYQDHPSTGMMSTHRMMLELSRSGHHDEAYRLLNLRTVPSWGYMVDMGATTIWERWDGYVAGRGFQDPGMNSFNHWAFGSVGEWVWRELVGINPDESQPGLKHFIIRPRRVAGLTWVKAEYDSIHGKIAVEWRLEDGRLTLRVAVPTNTTATVYVPAKSADSVFEGNSAAASASGAKFVGMEDGAAVFEVDSGQFAFRAVQ